MTIPLMLIFIGLQIADGITTTVGLAHGAIELNPIARHFGVWPTKAVGTFLVGIAAIYASWWMLLGVCILIAGAVGWNLVQLHKVF